MKKKVVIGLVFTFVSVAFLSLVHEKMLGVKSWTHYDIDARLVSLERYESFLDSEILKIDGDVSHSYDALADAITASHRLADELAPLFDDIADGSATLSGALARYRSSFKARRSTIERFKSVHAVLRNSEARIPELYESLSQVAGEDPSNWDLQLMARWLGQFWLYISIKETNGLEIAAQSLDRFKITVSEPPPSVRPMAAEFVTHASLIIENKLLLNGFLETLITQKPDFSASDLANVYHEYYRAIEQEAMYYQYAMFTLTAFLCVAAIVAAFRLARASALVRAERLSNHAKSDFLARMSHEIRTPMNGVLGMADILSKTELNERQTRFIGTLKQSAETLLNIINDILDFSRIEAGKVKLDDVDFDLHDLVGDVVEMLAESGQSKGIETSYLLFSDVPQWVRGDPHRLRQILINLLGNAIKFTEDGEVTLRVTQAKIKAGNRTVLFEVTDSGIGIEPDRLDSLFAAFEQADGSVTRRYGGTGLGLAITKQLVELMGGQIKVKSSPGKGSKFSFAIGFSLSGKQFVSDEEMAGLLKAKRILVVDDNATNREILQHYLVSWDAEHLEASDGQEALGLLRAAAKSGHPIDLILLDMMMPQMCGLEFADKVRSQSEIADVPIIMLTSLSWDNELYKSDMAGIHAVITKPVRPNELYDQVCQTLGTQVHKGSSGTGRRAQTTKVAEMNTVDAHILLVEDNPVNQEVAREYLENMGCTVDLAENGCQALDALRAGSYSIVIMDIQMPEMDGLEATRRIREEEVQAGRRRTPIIALTANAFEQDREKCLMAGMDDYLSKPFEKDQLELVIKSWLVSGLAAPSNLNAQAPAESQDAVLDQKALDQLRALQRPGAPSFVDKIIRTYMSTAPNLIDALKTAVENEDLSEIKRAAHSLKSSSANVGASAFSELCRDFEHLSLENRHQETRALLPKLTQLFAGTQRALERELTDNSSHSLTA